MSLENNIISSLKGDFIWNGIETEILLPLSILDLICIHGKNYDQIISCVFSIINDSERYDIVSTISDIINHGGRFNVNEKYHINSKTL